MIIILRRIKKTSFDDLLQEVISNYEANKKLEINNEDLENNSEDIVIDGSKIQLSYDVSQYLSIASTNEEKYKKLARIGMLLHKDTKDISGITIPKNVLYEKEVWTYLSFKVFPELIKMLKMQDEGNLDDDKISRLFFNLKQRSRTGLLFLWSMIDLLESEDDFEISVTAFHFIDPVKAIYERTMSRNPAILKSFVRAIILLGKDNRIKNKKYKVRIPNNISCFARINCLDAYDDAEMTSVIVSQITEILGLS